jgi:pimeloyl-ACP methyl ester carboxylesterase
LRRWATVLFGGASAATAAEGDTWELLALGALQVTGRVLLRTATSSPIPLVNITVDVLQSSVVRASATTDAQGVYTVTLPASAQPGNYTIRATIKFPGTLIHPDVVNYRYANQTQTPTLNPEQDQISLGPGLNAGLDIEFPKPLILVHGLIGSPNTWTTAQPLFQEDPGQKSQQGIAHRAYPTWASSYAAYSIDNTHDQNADILHREIQQIKAAWSSALPANSPVDIVAHSMGGLITRAYLHKHSQIGDVDRVITLGTPHLGAWYLFGQSILGVLPPSLQQMDPLYLGLTFPQTFFNPKGARFILVGSSMNCNCLPFFEPELSLLLLSPSLAATIGWDDDGWVSTWSAIDEWNYLRLPVLASKKTPDLHISLTSNQATLIQVMDWLEQHR